MKHKRFGLSGIALLKRWHPGARISVGYGLDSGGALIVSSEQRSPPLKAYLLNLNEMVKKTKNKSCSP